MDYGECIPEGFLPVYSVGNAEEAKALLVLTCETNNARQFIAKELAAEQTLDNLFAFGDRLNRYHAMLVQIGNCSCEAAPNV